jgi:hypothetical protein
LTPTITSSPTIVPTATSSFPTVTVKQQAHCRYGPAVAYLHAADLYVGDKGTVQGRALYSNWLYIKFDKLLNVLKQSIRLINFICQLFLQKMEIYHNF